MQRILVGIVTLASVVLAAMPSALAQGYPARPVRVITLTAAGGSLDIMARTLAQSLTETMGQQFYVENKLGAGGNIGVAELARSAPDGYTIGMITVSTHGINPSLYGSKLTFDALNDFEILAIAAELKNVVVVHPKVPATNMQELVRYAKANPGKISFGSAESAPRSTWQASCSSSAPGSTSVTWPTEARPRPRPTSWQAKSS
jgi:tripartite-type tricarboxylate transporter receptor subunit TctC